jgi:hypothetical protein
MFYVQKVKAQHLLAWKLENVGTNVRVHCSHIERIEDLDRLFLLLPFKDNYFRRLAPIFTIGINDPGCS